MCNIKSFGTQMKTSELDTKDAGQYGWFSARDARMKNYAKQSHYSEKQKVQAERIKLGLEMVYNCDEIHINYRDKFIAIKVGNARVRDSKTLQLLESDYEKADITK